MSEQTCKHCGNPVSHAAEPSPAQCPHCGMPLSAHSGRSTQRTFLLWFVAIVILCLVAIVLVPPDWSQQLVK